MKLWFIALFLLGFVSTVTTPPSFAAGKDPVRVEQGLLSGVPGANADVRVYRGIPYAAPPVGDLRWRPPQPPAAWQGVRDAGKFGATCWQVPYPPAAAIFQNDISTMSEDCLHLNLWTPAKTANDRLPVMVWIHGGGLTRGSSTTPMYDGENLARKGVVVVTLNYRLGIFGFFANPELASESAHHASGNYGLLDQVAALQWVKKNIAAFGGDPNRVTIFGESAGSWSVCALTASPLAKGLFARAIGESGGLFAPMLTQEKAEKEGERIAATLVTNAGPGATTAAASSSAADGPSNPSSAAPAAKKDVLKALRAMPAEELAKTNPDTARANVDGWFLPQDVYSTFAQGKQNDVPLLVGNNADEGTIFAPPAGFLTAAVFSAGARQRLGDLADQFFKVYPAGSDQEALASYLASFRDLTFGWEMRTWARMQVKTGHHPVYRYYFTRRPPGRQSARLGAFHASEIPYVFGNFVWPFPWEDVDHKLSDAMAGYWVNFAATGNPNAKGLPEWPAYDPEKDAVLELGDQVAVGSHINKAGLDFYDAYFQERMKPQSAAGTK
ncbi:MAG: carboxylesterase family protein [Acidobacteriia bacterium]|nr:carboxylesterase family protein [Terriglobia bacterium]